MLSLSNRCISRQVRLSSNCLIMKINWQHLCKSPHRSNSVHTSVCWAPPQLLFALVHLRFPEHSFASLILSCLRWEPSKKDSGKARIDITGIREVRPGKTTDLFLSSDISLHFPDECSFSIVHGDGKTLDLIANSADDANVWITGTLIDGYWAVQPAFFSLDVLRWHQVFWWVPREGGQNICSLWL